MTNFILFCFVASPVIITCYFFFKMGMYIMNGLATMLENSLYNITNWMKERGLIDDE